ncbi:DUF3309 family protein [Tranquillimonas alkanivorans]|uniref:Uncharacterized protein n=1 Tax=Tranquillimonas alkanivorans TaxID=441119 RepID=A0A1I5KB95_9RHOB|nr:hypothetical protein [Tranquillimonas alkanivorans]SFO82352.1 hypothetical protein SAMN04488047_1016 [Tranquillimonas alkanivorans]
MDVFLFWLIVLLLLFAVLALPAWPYTRDRGIYRQPGNRRYAPSLVAAAIVLLMLVLFWLGLLAIWVPWAAVETAT